MKQRTYNYQPSKRGKFRFTQPSQTVPDDSYSIKEILMKFTRGIDPMLTKLPTYDDDEINEDLSESSFKVNPLTEVEDLTSIDDIRHEINFLQDELKRIENLNVQKQKEGVTESSATQQ